MRVMVETRPGNTTAELHRRIAEAISAKRTSSCEAAQGATAAMEKAACRTDVPAVTEPADRPGRARAYNMGMLLWNRRA